MGAPAEAKVAYDPAVVRAAARAAAAQAGSGFGEEAEPRPRPLAAQGGGSDQAAPQPRPLARKAPPRGLAAGAPKAAPLRARPDPSDDGAVPAALMPAGRGPRSGDARSTDGGSTGGSRRFRKRYGDVEVGVCARWALAQWARYARRSLKAKREYAAAEAAERRARGAVKRRKRARMDRLMDLYMQNQEEVERLCYDEPETMILTQIELLTWRIDDITVRKRLAERVERGALQQPSGDVAPARPRPQPAAPRPRAAATNDTTTWQEAFNRAMTARKNWEQDRGQAHAEAASEARRRWLERPEAAAPEPKKEDSVVAQLRAERERLNELLTMFDSKMRKQKRRAEERIIDEVESFQQEQRAAMDEQARILRERRRRQAEEQRRLEQERVRQEEERVRREEERRKREEEEKRRRQKEEEEMHRMMREWEEDERRRREELRQAKEEEAKRLAREAEEARRRHAEELERRRREAEEERRRLERQRLEEEQQREAEERAKRKAERSAFLDDVFDDLERACDSAGVEETLDAVHAELAQGGTPPGSPPSDAGQRMSGNSSAGGADALMATAKQQGPGADWMARAMAALGGDEEDSSDEEAEGADEAGAVADDLELLKFTEAIATRIEQLHRH